jgi:hypothetical protein
VQDESIDRTVKMEREYARQLNDKKRWREESDDDDLIIIEDPNKRARN